MIQANEIKPGTPVVCCNDGQFAFVDHMEGNKTIKLKKDKQGQHHYIPLEWVTKVDDKVHIDRPGMQAMQEWTTTSGAKAQGQPTQAKNVEAKGTAAKNFEAKGGAAKNFESKGAAAKNAYKVKPQDDASVPRH